MLRVRTPALRVTGLLAQCGSCDSGLAVAEGLALRTRRRLASVPERGCPHPQRVGTATGGGMHGCRGSFRLLRVRTPALRGTGLPARCGSCDGGLAVAENLALRTRRRLASVPERGCPHPQRVGTATGDGMHGCRGWFGLLRLRTPALRGRVSPPSVVRVTAAWPWPRAWLCGPAGGWPLSRSAGVLTRSASGQRRAMECTVAVGGLACCG